MSIWYQLDSTEVLQQLDTNAEHGLSQPEVAHRLKKYGFSSKQHPYQQSISSSALP